MSTVSRCTDMTDIRVMSTREKQTTGTGRLSHLTYDLTHSSVRRCNTDKAY